MTEGTARLSRGTVAEGLSLLDEAMLPVQAGAVPPDFAGNLYCQMIAICWELSDLRRAREWTAAIARWCEGFESAVMFSGICRMHQVQLRQVAGEWDVAAEQAHVVCAELVGMNVAVVAEGHYLRADLLRLRGRVSEAEAAYLQAHELGRDPQPGLALLRAQSGKVGAAVASLRSSLTGHRGAPYGRAPLLRALVDLAVDAHDLDAARGASAELSDIAQRWRSDGLLAAAAHAGGVVALASNQPAGALAVSSRSRGQVAGTRRALRLRHGADGSRPGALGTRRRLLGPIGASSRATDPDRPPSHCRPAPARGSTAGATASSGGLTTAGDGDPRACRPRRHEPAGRGGAGDQREDGGPAPGQRPPQARRLDPDRGRRLGAAQRPARRPADLH